MAEREWRDVVRGVSAEDKGWWSVHTYPDIFESATFSSRIHLPSTRIRNVLTSLRIQNSMDGRIRKFFNVMTSSTLRFSYFLRFCSDCGMLVLIKAKEAKKERNSLYSDEFAAKFVHIIGFCACSDNYLQRIPGYYSESWYVWTGKFGSGYGYMWTRKFSNLRQKMCRFKNIRIRVDGVSGVL